MRCLLPVDSRKLAEAFAIRQREVLQVMLDVSDISDESSYYLATLRIQQRGTAGLCHPLDIVKPVCIRRSIHYRLFPA